MLTNQSIGYMDAPVPKDIDLKEAIDKLRKEKNAVILAHYYQTGDIQDENQMEIGFVTRKNLILSKLGQEYVMALRQYLAQ